MGLSSEFSWQFRLAAALRTPILMFIVVPLSFLLWVYKEIRGKYRAVVRKMYPDEDGHNKRVGGICQQVIKWDREGRKKPLRTARPNWSQMSTKLGSNKGECHLIDVTGLNHIISLDEENMSVTAEPSVTMGDLTHYLLPLGYALEVQVEMEAITLGGVCMGFGMETNSHVSGFFQETILAIEMVDSHGNVIHVTAESDPELFYALPWSHGTLGYITQATVKIVKVQPFIHMQYIPTYDVDVLTSKMQELAEAEDAPRFLEATIYSKHYAVIQVGRYAAAAEVAASSLPVNPANRWYKPFFYKHVETFLEKGPSEEYIPLKDYYHRFTRSIFWEIEDMIPFSNHPLYRFLWGWMGAPEVSLLKKFQGPVIRKNSIYAHVVQESIVPIRHIGDAVRGFEGWFDLYPLLLFPLRVYDRGDNSGFLHPNKRDLIQGKDYGIWVDLGAYGVPRKVREQQPWDPKSNIRAMEHWTREKGGFQATYTDLFCTEREFRLMFDHTLLDKVRTRLDAHDAFPTVYCKVSPEKGLIDLSDIREQERAPRPGAR